MSFLFDASALTKRYVAEAGTPLVHRVFRSVPHGRLSCILQGAGEVISVLVRRRNAGDLTQQRFDEAMADLRREVTNSLEFERIEVDAQQVIESWALIEQHSINSTDALVLRVALDRAEELRENGDDLVLVASDERLVRAAAEEGLKTFNPETDSQSKLESLMA